MTTHPRTLLLAPECPYPLQGGGPMRTGSLLEYLARHSAVDLLTFREPGDPPPALPEKLCQTVDCVELPRHSKAFPARASRNVSRLLRRELPLVDRFCEPIVHEKVRSSLAGREWDVGVIEHLWCVRYSELLRQKCNKLVLDLHNVESALHESCARSEPRPQRWAHQMFQKIAEAIERDFVAKFDLVLVASQEDARRVARFCPPERIAVYPNTIPLVDAPQTTTTDSIAFSGNLEYHPNISAIKFFGEQVWPRLKADHPALSWRIIGKNAGWAQSWAQGKDDIVVTGPVENAIEELAKSKIVVVPLLAGSGTRVKIVEAWAAARAVVSSPIGAEGLPARDGENLSIVGSPGVWAQSVSQLLADQSLRDRLGREGRATYERRCSWPAAWRSLEGPFASIWPDSSSKGTG